MSKPVLVLVLLGVAQCAVLAAIFWPWEAGVTAMLAWLVVGVAASLLVLVGAGLLVWSGLTDGVRRGIYQISVMCLICLPVANLVYFAWWPTAEKLGTAAANGDVAEVERHLAWGLAPDATYETALGFGGRSEAAMPLTRAANGGHLEVVRLLIEHGADIHHADEAALSGALYAGSDKVVAYLLQRGAAGHAVFPSTLVAGFGGSAARLQAAAVMLTLQPELIDAPGLLIVAAHKGSTELARLIAEVDVAGRFGPVYELYRSVVLLGHNRGARREYAPVLEQYDRIPSLQVPQTEALRAASLHHLKSADRRLPRSTQDISSDWLLQLAVRFGQQEIVAGLLERGVPPDPPIDERRVLQTSLQIAIRNSDPAMVQVLLDGGADLDRVHNIHGTPLHGAVTTTDQAAVEVLQVLLDAGASIDAPHSANNTLSAALLAVKLRRFDLAGLLVQQGADLSLLDAANKTVCDYACGELDACLTAPACRP